MKKDVDFLRREYKIVIFCVIIVMFIVLMRDYKNVNTDEKVLKWGNDWHVDGEKKSVSIPAKKLSSKKKFKITKKINEDVVGKCLFIKCHYQGIKVYVNGVIKKEFSGTNKGKTKILKSTGTTWVIFDFRKNYRGKNITIEYEAFYDKNRGEVNEILFGTKEDCQVYMLSREIIEIVICTIMIGIGLYILVLWFTMRKKYNIERFMEVGACIIGISLWAFLETESMHMLIKRPEISNILTYNCLMISAFAVSLYYYKEVIDEKMSLKKQFVQISVVFQMIVFIVINILKVFGIKDYSEISVVIHIGLIVAVGGGVVIELFRDQNYKKKSFILACIGLIILLIIELFPRYVVIDNFMGINNIARVGLIVYLSICAIKITWEIFDTMSLANSEKKWYDFAYTDILTKVGNRRKFRDKLDELQKVKLGTAVYSIDLNNLKVINDTYGHSAGDEYITTCVDVLKDIFNGNGDFFRTGGDEFVIIVEEFKSGSAETMLNKLDDVNRNLWVKKQKVSFSYGMAVYDLSKDNSIEDTIKRADMQMYDNKTKIKAMIQEKWRL